MRRIDRKLVLLATLALVSQKARAQDGLEWDQTSQRRPTCSLVGGAGDQLRSVAVVDLDGDGRDDIALGGALASPVDEPDCDSEACQAGVVYLLGSESVEPDHVGQVFVPEVAVETWRPSAREARAGSRLLSVRRPGPDLLGVTMPRRAQGGEEQSGGLWIVESDLAGGSHVLETEAVAAVVHAEDKAVLGRWTAAGDIDGDGIADVVVSSSDTNGGGAAWVYGTAGCPLLGTADPFDCPPMITVTGGGNQLGRVVEVLPDLDGDGLGELAVVDELKGDPDVLSRTHVFYGRDADSWCPTQPCAPWSTADADVTFVEERPDRFATSQTTRVRLALLGDLDGDGRPDLGFASEKGRCGNLSTPCNPDGVLRVLFTNGPLPPQVVLGDSSGGQRWLTVDGPGGKSEFGIDTVGLDDFDGDGWDDFAVAAAEQENRSTIWFVGGPLAPAIDPVSIEEVATTSVLSADALELGLQMLGRHDLDGDGFPDLLATERAFPGSEGGQGRVIVFYGGPLSLLDGDGDGWFAPGRCGPTAADCDDADPTTHPGIVEANADSRNCRDDNCDGLVDEGQLGLDSDGDGACEGAPDGFGGLVCTVAGATPGDCNDCDSTVHPGADEGPPVQDGLLPNGQDDDCDGLIDEGTLGSDDDGDGFCEGAPGEVPCIDGSSPGDCDDGDEHRYPGADDVVDGLDNDCDGLVDDTALGCQPPSGTTGLGLFLFVGLVPMARRRRGSSAGQG